MISSALSWDLWPDWVVRYVEARSLYMGIEVRQAEIDIMQSSFAITAVVAPIFSMVWLALVAIRIRRGRTGLADQPAAKTTGASA